MITLETLRDLEQGRLSAEHVFEQYQLSVKTIVNNLIDKRNKVNCDITDPYAKIMAEMAEKHAYSMAVLLLKGYLLDDIMFEIYEPTKYDIEPNEIEK